MGVLRTLGSLVWRQLGQGPKPVGLGGPSSSGRAPLSTLVTTQALLAYLKRRNKLVTINHRTCGALYCAAVHPKCSGILLATMRRVHILCFLLLASVLCVLNLARAWSDDNNATDTCTTVRHGNGSCSAEDMRQLPDDELEHLAAMLRRYTLQACCTLCLHAPAA